MSKPHHSGWGLLLLCAVGMAFLAGPVRPAAGGDPHVSYLPAIFKNWPAFPYQLQPGSPVYLANFINTSGCNWFGFAGRAFGLDGNPVINLTVHLEGGGIKVDTLTGSGPAALGVGSYLIQISDHPIETSGVYFIQLRSSVGTPLSDVFMIPTYADCTKNLVLVNFTAGWSLPTYTPTPSPPTQAYPTLTPTLAPQTRLLLRHRR